MEWHPTATPDSRVQYLAQTFIFSFQVAFASGVQVEHLLRLDSSASYEVSRAFRFASYK